jgi:histidinol phosphatase-like enzyme
MSKLFKEKVYVIDIDGTICTQDGSKYENARPIQEIIDMSNRLFDQGHKIIFFTARGSTTGIDWSKLTHNQLNAWGVKYHQIILGKPYGDYYVDDKAMKLEEFKKLLSVISE